MSKKDLVDGSSVASSVSTSSASSASFSIADPGASSASTLRNRGGRTTLQNTLNGAEQKLNEGLKEYGERAEQKRLVNRIRNDLGGGCVSATTTILSLSAGALLGLGLNVALAAWFMYLLRPKCPTVYGRPCNGLRHGECLPEGVCRCTDARFSGPACSDTGIAGYSLKDDTECYGRGNATVLLQSAALFPACRYVNPSRDNSYAPFEPSSSGWHNEACKTEMSRIATKLVEGDDLTDAEWASYPLCLCDAPKYGIACDLDGCPTSLDFKVCSGYGDTSVGIFNNYTGLPGNGCQCSHPFLIADHADEIAAVAPNLTQAIHDYYPDLWTKQMCGELVIRPGAIFVKIDTTENVFKASLRCYCQDSRSGVACEKQKCPENEFGDVCNGYGSPLVGNGVEFNTTRSISRVLSNGSPVPCRPRCQGDYVYCPLDNTCRVWGVDPCVAKIEETCPPARPYRCRNGDCVVKGSPNNGDAFEDGFLDDLENVLVMQRCEGVADCGLADEVVLQSPLSFFTMAVLAPLNESVSVRYDSQEVVFVGDESGGMRRFHHVFTYPSPTDPVDFVESNLTAHIVKVSETKYLVVPDSSESFEWHALRDAAPFPVTTTSTEIRLSSIFTTELLVFRIADYEEVLGDYDGITKAIFVIDPDTNEAILSSDGTRADVSACLGASDGVDRCGWVYVNSTLLPLSPSSQTRYACWDFSTSLSPCWPPAQDAWRTPNGAFAGDFSTPTTALVDFTRSYSIQIAGVATHVLSVRISSDAVKIFDANFVTFETLVSHSACPPYLTSSYLLTTNINQSYHNALWLASDSRKIVSLTAGDRVAAPVVHNGKTYSERGVVVSTEVGGNAFVSLVLFDTKNFSAVVPSDALRYVSQEEFEKVGLLECPRSFSTRTPDGGCANPVVFETHEPLVSAACDSLENSTLSCTTPSARCACTATNCTCSDGDRVGETVLFEAIQTALEETECRTFTSYPNGTIAKGEGDRFVVVNAPVEIRSVFVNNAGCGRHFDLLARDTRYVDDFVSIPVGEICSNDVSEVVPLTTGDFAPGTEFVVSDGVSTNLTSGVRFNTNPFLDAFAVEAYAYTASSNSIDAENARSTNATYWAADPADRFSYISMSFADPTVVTSALVRIRNAAFAVGGRAVEFPLLLEYSTDGGSAWSVEREFRRGSGDVHLNLSSPLAPLTNVRVRGAYPFSVSEFSAYTNQSCTRKGVFLRRIVHDGSAILDAKLDAMNRRGGFNWPFEVCTGTDSCASARNGACEDEIEVARLRKSSERLVVYAASQLDATQYYSTVFGSVFANESALTSFTTSSPSASPTDYPTGGPPSESPTESPSASPSSLAAPSFSPTASPTRAIPVVVWEKFSNPSLPDAILFHTTDVSVTNVDALAAIASYLSNSTQTNLTYVPAAFLLLEAGTANVVFPPSEVNASFVDGVYTIYAIRSDYGVSSVAPCARGTDVSDCGFSWRRGGPIPNATCTGTSAYLTARDLEIVLDRFQRNVTDWTPDEYFSLVGDGGLYNFDFTIRIELTNASRLVKASYPHRVAKCPDGRPREYPLGDCPATRYDCWGDGCIQVDSRFGSYMCACAEGRGGLACDLHVCHESINSVESINALIADGKYTSTADPHGECRCGAPPPLRERPPASLLRKKNLRAPDVERINRKTKRLSPLDVDWVNVKALHAPYAPVLMPLRTLRDGTEIYSTCPYAHFDAFGRYHQLHNDVESRDPVTKVVTAWRVFQDLKGNNVTYPWSHETAYDEAPYRCPVSGICVEGPEQCQLYDGDKRCSGHGTCLVDGTCACDRGWMTFILTESFTRTKEVSYYFDQRYNLTDPTRWEVNDNWNDYRQQCNVRDCTVQDCSPPYGCFAGTPPDFSDKHVMCVGKRLEGNSGFALCAKSPEACARGETYPMMPCSGRGIVRRHDNRDPPDYYCECGTPFFDTATRTSQLVKNGFGGEKCDVYQCAETTIKFSPYDPVTGASYRDFTGARLKGKWIGYCGAHIGPDPDDVAMWQRCCHGEYEQCENVLCELQDEVQCVPSEQCVPRGGKPRVYPLNNHGTVRADGTGDCTRDEVTGLGYAPEIGKFTEDDNCYAKIKCKKSEASGTACNLVAPCSNPKKWKSPPIQPYFNDQVDVLLGKNGYQIDNREVMRATTDVQEFDALKLQAFSKIALDVIRDRTSIGSCVCIYPPPDSCANPIGMLPYCPAESVVGPYAKAFRAPYLTKVVNESSPTLTDGWITSAPLASNPDRVNVGTNRTFLLERLISVSAIRIHAYFVLNDTILYLDANDGGTMCPPLTVNPNAIGKWAWHDQYCVPEYRNVVFGAETPGYTDTCVPNEFTDACEKLKRASCEATAGNVWFEVNDFHARPRGCDAECCGLKSGALVTPRDRFVFSLANGASVPVDEIHIFGYADTIVSPVAPGLARELQRQDNATSCHLKPDQRFMQQFLAQDESYFLPGDDDFHSLQTVRNRTGAKDSCEYNGGKLASTRNNDLDDSNLAMADACRDKVGYDQHCFVDLIDTTYETAPASMTDFIQSSCTAYGCYFDRDDDFVDYTSARLPDIWTSAWTSKLLPWTDVAILLNRLERQTGLEATSSYVIHALVTGNLNIITGDMPNSYKPRYDTNVWTHWDYRDLSDPTAAVFDLTNPAFSGMPTCSISLHNTQLDSKKLDPGLYDPTRRVFKFMSDYGRMRHASVLTDVPSTCEDATYHLPCINPSTDKGIQNGYCGLKGVDSFSYEDFGKNLLSSTDFPHALRCFGDSSYAPCKAKDVYLLNYIPGWTVDNGVKAISSVAEAGCYAVVDLYDISHDTTTTKTIDIGPDGYNFGANERATSIRIFPGIVKNQGSRFSKWEVAFGGEESQYKGDPTRNGMNEFNMGWRNQPYMPMRVWRREVAYVDAYGYHTVPNAQWTNVGGSSDAATVFRHGGGSLTVTPDKFVRSSDYGRPFLECRACEVKKFSNREWNVEVWLGGGFPQQATGQDSRMVIYRWRGLDGKETYVRLVDMANDRSMQRGFARQSTVNTLSDYLVRFGKDWCTAISTSRDLTVYGSFVPKPCDLKLNYVCMLDYIKYTSVAGTVCDACGISSRNGGYARANTTCYDDYPMANRTKYPYENLVTDHYDDGTLNQFIPKTDYDYDAGRAFYDRIDPQTNTSKGYIWAIPDARRMWDLGVNTRPGFSTSSDSYAWFDFSPHPYDCGPVRLKKTGEIVHICAIDGSFCGNPDATFDLVPMARDDYPAILNPVAPERLRFEATCGISVRPSLFTTYDVLGSGTPGFTEQFDVLESDALHLMFRALVTNVDIYNTGKDTLSYVFDGDVNVTGQIDLACATCTAGVNVTMWIAPIDPRYLFPSQKIDVANFVVPNGDGFVYDFSFSHNASEGTVTYQVMGWSFTGLDYDATVSVHNALITDATAAEKCSVTRGKAVRYERTPFVVSTVPDNKCIWSKTDVLVNRGGEIGKCWCDDSLGGESCDCPAYYSKDKKEVCGGYGDAGKVYDPNGNLVDTSSSPDEKGCFSYKDADGDVRFGCKCRNIGVDIITTLLPDTAYTHLRVFVLDNPYGTSPYTSITTKGNVSLAEAKTTLLSNAQILPSWVNGEEMDAYLSTTSANLPVFVDLIRHNETSSHDLRWETRGVPLKTCNSLDCDGTPLGYPVVSNSSSNWTTELVEIINFNNEAYSPSAGSVFDGRMDYAIVSSVSRTVTFASGAKTRTAYVWAYSFSSLALTGCTLDAVVSPIRKYTCNNVSSVTISASNANISEIQILSDDGRVPFYDYV